MRTTRRFTISSRSPTNLLPMDARTLSGSADSYAGGGGNGASAARPETAAGVPDPPGAPDAALDAPPPHPADAVVSNESAKVTNSAVDALMKSRHSITLLLAIDVCHTLVERPR